MIVISGATGRLGSLIVERVLERFPDDAVGVSVRDVSAAAWAVGRGVRVRAGDFTDPASLTHAFEGADQVVVVSPAIRGSGAAAASKAAIDAARDAGATRIIYTSHQAAAPDSLFPPNLVHIDVESYLEQCGVPFTALRNGFYASTLEYYLPQALSTGRLAAPEDGPVSWTAHSDLAEAAAHAVSGESMLSGVTNPLTASDAVDFTFLAKLLGDLAGRSIERVTLDDDEWKDAAVRGGMPAPAADFTLGLFRASRRGEFDVTDQTLATVIGRPPISVRTVVEAIVEQAAA